ncbi:MAG: hypothetical protein KH317_07920, partial [Clostridiales bacterium]|nr:hypothetical protein [Clostridiales bacterium]
GIDPYPAAEYVTNAFSTDIKAEFKDDEEPRQVSPRAYCFYFLRLSILQFKLDFPNTLHFYVYK